MKFKASIWKTTHPFIVADRYDDDRFPHCVIPLPFRMENLPEPEVIRTNPQCNRTVSLYGYVRGRPIKSDTSIPIPGCGDFRSTNISSLPDPCALPTDRSTKTKQARRVLNEKERLLYAPFFVVEGIVYDKDAVYIELGGSRSHQPTTENEKVFFAAFRPPNDVSFQSRPINEYVNNILFTRQTIEKKVASSQVKLFADGEPVVIDNQGGEQFQRTIVQSDIIVRYMFVSSDHVSFSPVLLFRFDEHFYYSLSESRCKLRYQQQRNL